MNLLSEAGARALENFLAWHKATKDWLRDDRPFHTVRQYNLILDYYQQLEDYYRANNRPA